MRLKVINSSSAGNGYIFQTSTGEVLLYEAGVSLSKIKAALNFDLSRVIGCICTHVHGDHTGHVHDFLNAGITVYLSPETAAARGPHHNIKVVQAKKTYQIGSFKITPVALKHDVENYGFLIYHAECGLCISITDTHYCPYTFPGLNNILVELNYSDEILNKNLDAGKTPMFVRNRIIKSHMELQTTIDFLKANDLSKVNNIVLLHLSDANSNSAQFKETIQEVTGKQVFVAEPNLDIALNVTPF